MWTTDTRSPRYALPNALQRSSRELLGCGLFPLRGQHEAHDDEAEANTDVHQPVGLSTDGVHHWDLRAGHVEDDDVEQADHEAGHHDRG